MVQWVIRSIPHGRPIELFLVSASVSSQYMLSCMFDGALKNPNLAANRKRVAHVVVAVGFLSDYLIGPLSYV